MRTNVNSTLRVEPANGFDIPVAVAFPVAAQLLDVIQFDMPSDNIEKR